jgi:regulatory protein spx
VIKAYLYTSCTSCRKTDELLKASGVPYERREFFKERFSEDELRQVLGAAGLSPGEVLSKRSRVYKDRGLEHQQLTDDELLALMVEEPTLLRRPLVMDGDQVIVGHNAGALEEMIARQAAP